MVTFNTILFASTKTEKYVDGVTIINLSSPNDSNTESKSTFNQNSTQNKKPKEEKSKLKVEFLNFYEDSVNVSLVGSVYYNQKIYSLNITGNFYQSHKNPHNILVGDIENKDSNLDIVFWAIQNNAEANFLASNSSLINKQVMTIQLYDSSSLQLFGFDINLSDFNSLDLNGQNYKKSDTVVDWW